jgi:hypothetical protein
LHPRPVQNEVWKARVIERFAWSARRKDLLRRRDHPILTPQEVLGRNGKQIVKQHVLIKIS